MQAPAAGEGIGGRIGNHLFCENNHQLRIKDIISCGYLRWEELGKGGKRWEKCHRVSTGIDKAN